MYLNGPYLDLLCTFRIASPFMTFYIASICHIIHTLTNLNFYTITNDGERDVIGSMEKCVADIKIYMTNNMLKLTRVKLLMRAPRIKYKYLQPMAPQPQKPRRDNSFSQVTRYWGGGYWVRH